MATHIKFTKEDAFDDIELAKEMMSFVHIMNDAGQGEHTLCGMAFDGDGKGLYSKDEMPFVKVEEKITCPDCIKQIDFCKSIKSIEINRKYCCENKKE